MTSPSRALITAAIKKLQRYDQPVTIQTVKANIDIGALTMSDATEALAKHTNAQIPLVLKQEGFIIADSETGERKRFWESTPDELEEQLQIKERSSGFDQARTTADRAVLTFLRAKETEFGYAVYPELFEDDITRIYAMHSLQPPAHGVATA